MFSLPNKSFVIEEARRMQAQRSAPGTTWREAAARLVVEIKANKR
jgi:hypothetical protein